MSNKQLYKNKMNTYLLSWNPKRWEWSGLQDCIKNIEEKGWDENRWSCGRSRRIIRGDRVFLIRLGKKPKGIIASGWVDSDYFEDYHWDDTLAKQGKKSNFIDVNFNVLLDAEQEPILSIDELKFGIFSKVKWDSQMPGILIPEDVAVELEKLWLSFLLNHPRMSSFSIKNTQEILPDEFDETETYYEGSIKRVAVNIYERNPDARNKCIKHYGLNCSVCGFNFESVYGNYGREYIHVHHLKPIADIGTEYELNPIEDLRPVCPNCHAMLHRTKPAKKIEELRKRIKKQHFV